MVSRAFLWEEPFRLFFPWGIVVGMVGVLLWPLFLWHWISFFPGQAHARLLTLGWGGAFILGFLGTAGPRTLGVNGLQRLEVGLIWVLHAAASAACVLGHEVLGSGLFAMALGYLLVWIAAALFVRRTDLPPPGFLLAMLGLACGVIGAAWCATGMDVRGDVPWGFRMARLLMDEAFLLLPILGVGGFLLPRILGMPGRHVFPDGRTPAPGWWRLSIECLIFGVLVLGSLVLEAMWSVRWGALLRVALILVWWTRDLPLLWSKRVAGTQAWMIRLGLAAMPVGWLARAVDPARLYAVEHILFVSGFGVVMFGIAARVTDGHSGNRVEAKGRSVPLRWIFWLAVLAMSTRVTADYIPKIQVSHYIYAALTWVAIGVLWLRAYRRKLLTPDPEA